MGYTLHYVLPLNPEYCKICHSNANLQLSWIKQILCIRSADELDRLLLAIKPVVGKRHSAGRIFSADIRLTEIRRLIRISAAAGGTAIEFYGYDAMPSVRCAEDMNVIGTLAYPEGRVRGFKPPIESSKNLYCVFAK